MLKIRRSGRHKTPSQMERMAETAAKAAPAMAVAGVLVAVPHSTHQQRPVTKHTAAAEQVLHARLDSAVDHAQQSAWTYTVRSGDTLSSIAQRFYHKASDWAWLYHVNQREIRNPNLIYPGERLSVPADPPADFRLSVEENSGYQPRHAKPASTSDSDTTEAGASSGTGSTGASDGGAAAVTASVSTGSGSTTLSGTLGCSGLETLWEEAGGSPAAAVTAASIAMAESGGQQYATGPFGERGYWQINPVNGALSTYDPYGNARAAVIMSDDGTNWSAWTTYTTGAYLGRC